MITKDNFKALLKHLNFEENKDIFTKKISNSDIALSVNFKKEELIYPELLGMVINERQTCNFSAKENFVVFECVHRLLEKGYLPKHLELEPKWKLGHGASGGRADILIKNQEEKPLLLIECKNAGNDFKKAWKETQQHGAQLFSYAQQIHATEFLCLYASDFEKDEDKITISQEIISHKDNKDVLEQDKKLKAFEQANNVKERYDVWKNTYQLESTQTGIFEDNIQAYQIGKNKYTLEDDTKPLSSINKKGLYHDFRTILRKHNVSRRENAFDVLVNLFLCKIIDETENKTDLKFYWKGIAYDNYYSLVDRLQELYQIGMKTFLDDEILYVSNDEIDDVFWTTNWKNKANRNATKKRIKEIFRELKFFKGLDFEFVKVHNSKGFDKNAKVLIDIIKMWQGVRLTSQDQNQFLGDMFEYFLDNGIKQTEGQFFTPIPVCKFILASLPLEDKIQQKAEPLKVIDYACGSGHFLTEYAISAKPIIEKYKETPVAQHYQQIFGIEKEDRLAKVASVSACMYGQNEITIIDTDALAQHSELQRESFDILVANPPFAVDDFLETLVQNDEKEVLSYELFANANIGTNNIQCFFLERAKHLLNRNGITGIIVPSSVLSNSDTMHIQTREILLKYFDFVSIVEFGSGTFGKTGTNTVVLFLKRKAQNPEQAEHFWNRTLDFFENAEEEIKTYGGIYQDLDVLKKYCEQIEIPFETYQILLLNQSNLDELWKHDIFKDYKDQFEKSTEIKNLKKKKFFKDKSAEEKEIELQKRLLEYIQTIEKDKLYYFMLAFHNQRKVLIVKSPNENKKQKQFLGYEWTNTKGQEGIKYHGGETVFDIITPLFDPKNTDNSEKISFAIRQNFGEKPLKELPEYCAYASTVDMLDFSRTDFNKTFSLNPKKKIQIETKWDLVKLGTVCENPQYGANEKAIDGNSEKDYRYIRITDIDDNGNLNTEFKTVQSVDEKYILDDGDFLFARSGNTVGKTLLYKSTMGKALYAGYLIRFKTNKEKLLPAYLNIYTSLDIYAEWVKYTQTGTSQPNINGQMYSDMKIALPPLKVQNQIVSECEKIDSETQKAEETIQKLKAEIEEIITKDFEKTRLENVIEKITDNINPQELEGLVNYIGLENIESQTGKLVGNIQTEYNSIKSTKICYQKGDILYGKLRPNLNKVYLAEQEGICSTDILVFRLKNPKLKLFYVHCLRSKIFNNEVLKTISGQQLPRTSWSKINLILVPIPALSEQEKIVSEISKKELEISKNQAIISASSLGKQAVMEKYL